MYPVVLITVKFYLFSQIQKDVVVHRSIQMKLTTKIQRIILKNQILYIQMASMVEVLADFQYYPMYMVDY
jgi:hypothetical protein